MNDSAQPSQDAFLREELSGVLLESVEAVLCEPISEEDLARALDRAAGLDSARPTRRARGLRILIAATVAAAALLVAIVLWRGHEPAAWAQVVEAVTKKPWLHAVRTSPDGTKGELWFSASRAVKCGWIVVAGPAEAGGGKQFIWEDFDAKTVDRYDPRKGVIVRMRDSENRMASDIYRGIFSAFLAAEPGRTIDGGRRKFVHQQQRVVKEEGRRCIEHRFKLQSEDDEADNTEWVVYVDPDTQLPFRWDQISKSPMDATRVSTQRQDIDYPATGPADIYALGVPKTAKMVDRSLPSDVEQLVAAVVARSRWADKRFSAVVVESYDGRPWWDGQCMFRVWSSGFRWRVDRSVGYYRPPGEPIPTGADPAAWWRQKAEKQQFRPETRCDGTWRWRYDPKRRSPTAAEIAAGASRKVMVIESNQKERVDSVRKDAYYEAYPIMMMGHPTNSASPPPLGMGIDAPDFDAGVDPKPKTGPPNTILLQVRDPNWKPITSQYGYRGPQMWRLWFFPKMGYLLVRWEELVPSEGKEEIIGGSVIEDAVQAPDGRWYPTIVRRLKAIRHMESDKREDQILRFYYDFAADMPDSLFEP
jgi:hypothetical protein